MHVTKVVVVLLILELNEVLAVSPVGHVLGDGVHGADGVDAVEGVLGVERQAVEGVPRVHLLLVVDQPQLLVHEKLLARPHDLALLEPEGVVLALYLLHQVVRVVARDVVDLYLALQDSVHISPVRS
eukprot:CAMPEP_0168608638 /NCGR_PEP_ID=MMETSP0449_2-20121227/745_1 /TAXON_ID=1082188 /ORGANISM="Strombidium rassoulzadegani, Strain ras09" /LENGTH=126 /DNA_ID=CAMNT_0008648659 /DNA_START=278 /DNA_END=658 /DNA_ORIENTATION=+